MAEIGPNASGGTENPLGKTETGTRKVTSRPTAPNQSVMATPSCQRRRNLHGFRQSYRADIVCYDKIILELKAVSALLPEHSAQLFNYLRATRMKLGFLVNFGHYPGVEVKRIAL